MEKLLSIYGRGRLTIARWIAKMTLINENWKPNFYKYEKVRRSGKYNMIIETDKAIKACGIGSREDRDTILSYGTYKGYIEAEYESVDKFMKKYKKCGF